MRKKSTPLVKKIVLCVIVVAVLVGYMSAFFLIQRRALFRRLNMH